MLQLCQILLGFKKIIKLTDINIIKKFTFRSDYNDYVLLNLKLIFYPRIGRKLFYFIFLSCALTFGILLHYFPVVSSSDMQFDMTNFNTVFTAELTFMLILILGIFIYKYQQIHETFNKYFKDNEYSITDDDEFYEVNIGNQFIQKYSWAKIYSIRNFEEYFIITTKPSKRAFSFFPRNATGAQELALFVKEKIKVHRSEK